MKTKKTVTPESVVPKIARKKKVALSKTKRKKKQKLAKKTKKSLGEVTDLKASAFYIVPWRRSADWENVCKSFIDGQYEDVIRELCIWRERVPSLPVGAESTIYLLQAIVADRQNKSDDEARSLYSLAVVRYLNHISHLATKEMGDDAPVPLSQLVSHLSVPQWIVELRHEISHGTSLPSLESLHEAADFIKTWLTDNYWVDPTLAVESGRPEIEILTNRKENKESKEEKYLKMCKMISGFLASKIYRLRATKLITDPEITLSLINQPGSVKPKTAMGFFKTKIANFFTTDPNLMCTAFASEMIPPESFFVDFCTLFNIPNDDENSVFEKYCEVWAPLISLVQSRGRLRQLCTLLGKVHAEESSTKTVKLLSALWLDNLLEKMEQEDKIFPFRLKTLLYNVITNPNEFTSRFLPRLLYLLENHLGGEKIQQLETLFNIWMDETCSAGKSIRDYNPVGDELFTIEDLPFPFTHITTNEQSNLPKAQSFSFQRSAEQHQEDWDMDYRDPHFWRRIPLGGEI